MLPATFAKLVATVLVFAVSITVFYVAYPGVPYARVDELAAWWHEGHEVKLRGWVRVGSIRESPSARTFELEANNVRIRVHDIGPRDRLLRDQAEIVVTGTLVGGELYATTAYGTCPHSYRDRENRNLEKFE
jgi:cytochrome c-type biogenesis protein CcmE